eukprot:4951725-Pyramimonas_sp.AAC.1
MVLHQGPWAPPNIRNEVLGLVPRARARHRASAGTGKNRQLLPERTGCPAENPRGICPSPERNSQGTSVRPSVVQLVVQQPLDRTSGG